jgi:outer membrane protein
MNGKSLIVLVFMAAAISYGFSQTTEPQSAEQKATARLKPLVGKTTTTKTRSIEPATASQANSEEILLNLDQAISRAVNNNPLIEQAMAHLSAARTAVSEAHGPYYPRITGSSSYTRIEPEQSFSIPELGSFSLGQEDNWDFAIGLDQILFASGRRAVSVQLAETGISTAQNSVDRVKMNLAYNTVQTFYTVLFLKEQVSTLDQQLADLEQHFSMIQKKEQTGSATKFDVLSTQVRVASLKSERISIRNKYQKALIALKALDGFNPEASVTPSGAFTAEGGDSGPDIDIQSLLKQALEDRPEVKQALAGEDSAGLGLKMARLERLPTLSAHTQAGFKNGILPNTGSLTFNWNAGVQLAVPLFNGLVVVDRIQEAQSNLDAARQNTTSIRRTVTTQVLQAFQDLSASREAVQMSLVQLRQSQEALDAAKVQYDLGVTTNVEYLDAQTALEQAKLAHLAAVYHEVLSEYSLKQSIGQRIWTTGTH